MSAQLGQGLMPVDFYDREMLENATGFAKLDTEGKHAILLMAATFAHKELSFQELWDKLDDSHKDEIEQLIQNEENRMRDNA